MTRNLESFNEYETRMNRALDYIHENLENDLSLENISRAACFSIFHFHRIFTSIIGETPNSYVRRLRLEKAANLLAMNNKHSVTDIAFQCGFSSSSVFARSFKEYFGVSAKKWKEEKFTVKNNNDNDYHNHLKWNKKEIWDKIEIRNLKSSHIAYIRSMKGYNKSIGKAWDNIFQWAFPRNLVGPDTQIFGIPMDNPDITPADKCRYFCCITVPGGINAHGKVSVMDIAGGKYALYHFTGLENDIARAYEELYGIWLPESGYTPDDRPLLELYSKDRQGLKKGIFKYDIALPIKPMD